MKNKQSSSFVPNWTKRWFSIEGPELTWYAAQHTPESSGQILLKNIKHVGVVNYENGIHSFSVESFSDQRSLLLKAESKSVLEMWCRAIQMHSDLMKGGDGTSVVTDSTESLNLREQKKETISDQLERNEQLLYQMENKLNQDQQDPWKCAAVVNEQDLKEANPPSLAESKCEKEDIITYVNNSSQSRRRTGSDWSDDKQDDTKGHHDNDHYESKCSEQKDERPVAEEKKNNRRKYSVTSLLSRKHLKVHV